ncbi:MAG: YCF48-related protein [Actinomycetota bacterium]|nr:YCF48-related protein [Actinomycetota bacterium]
MAQQSIEEGSSEMRTRLGKFAAAVGVAAVCGFAATAVASTRPGGASSVAGAAVADPGAQTSSTQQQHTRPAHARGGSPPYRVLDFSPLGAHTAWAVTNGNQRHDPPQSVQRSSDGGAHWSNVTPPGLSRAGRTTEISSADFVNRMRAWVVYGPSVGRQTLLSTSDGGRTWARVGRTPSYCAVQFVNPVDGWCVEIDGAAGSAGVAIYRTTTGGRSWREVSQTNVPSGKSTPNSIPFGCEKSVAFTSPTDGFAASVCNAGGGYIYATTDGGARWHQRLAVPTPVDGKDGAGFTPVVASREQAAAGYTVQGYKTTPTSSVVYHSTDGGARWRRVRPPGRPRGYAVDIVTPSVWRLVAGRTVLATDNAGRTWTRITANVKLSQNVSFTTTNVGWEGSSSGDSDNVLHTTDGGRHWTTIHVPQ